MASIAQDTADFAKLRTNGCIYVDKTASLHELICDPGRSLYFISRPRRFGKSLMLSTLDCIFQGRRDLFKGLAIDSLDYDWADYPILQFSFAGVKATSLEAFKAEFHVRVKKVLTEAQCAWDDAISPGANLNQAITDLAKMRGKPVAILIDEYDAPVGHALADIPLATAIRGELSDFYIQIKECASNVRFLMMTGVTRFTQLSVFSALNNLNDLTMDARYATLLGYTEEELGTFFDADMRAHAQVMGLAYDDYRAQLRWWYNGYRFAKSNMVRVYNPYAIAKTLGAKDPLFSPTWTRSGHPSVLINYLSDHELTEVDYDDVENVSEESLDICQLEAITPVAMLYQSGYLTIKDYSEWGFTLGVPNEEVRRALNALHSTPSSPPIPGSASSPKTPRPTAAPTSWPSPAVPSTSSSSKSKVPRKRPSPRSRTAATPSPIVPWANPSTSSAWPLTPPPTPLPTPSSSPSPDSPAR